MNGSIDLVVRGHQQHRMQERYKRACGHEKGA
jgi:hypothetical protein